MLGPAGPRFPHLQRDGCRYSGESHRQPSARVLLVLFNLAMVLHPHEGSGRRGLWVCVNARPGCLFLSEWPQPQCTEAGSVYGRDKHHDDDDSSRGDVRDCPPL